MNARRSRDGTCGLWRCSIIESGELQQNKEAGKKNAWIIAVAFIVVIAAIAFSVLTHMPDSVPEPVAEQDGDSLRIYFCSEVTALSAQYKASQQGGDPTATNGYNDCMLLEYIDIGGDAHYALIDTGSKWETGDDSTVTVEWLKSHGVEKLDWMLITHQHQDHMGAAASVFKDFAVDELYVKHYDGYWTLQGVNDEEEAREILGAGKNEKIPMNGNYYADENGVGLTKRSDSGAYAGLLKSALYQGTKIIGPAWDEVDPTSPICSFASPALSELESWQSFLAKRDETELASLFEPFDDDNTRFEFGPAHIEILNWKEYDAKGREWSCYSTVEHESVFGENENSLGVVIEVGDTRGFFAGDIEYVDTWKKVPKHASNVNDEDLIAEDVGDVDFYKVAHHGYRSSTSDNLMAHMKPEAAMITNVVGRAADEVLQRLDEHGTTYMYTTEDEVETIVELAPDAVRMARASDGSWSYKTPYHTISIVDSTNDEVVTTLTVRDGRDAELPDGFEAPVHSGYGPGILQHLPTNVRNDCTVVLEYRIVD